MKPLQLFQFYYRDDSGEERPLVINEAEPESKRSRSTAPALGAEQNQASPSVAAANLQLLSNLQTMRHAMPWNNPPFPFPPALGAEQNRASSETSTHTSGVDHDSERNDRYETFL